MSATKFQDYPFDDVCRNAARQILLGATVHQKFTCEKCGSRQTISTPNKFYTQGQCEECKHVTDIKARGCNMLLCVGKQP